MACHARGRFALVFGNAACVGRPGLSGAVAAPLRRRLVSTGWQVRGADDQTLQGMRVQTLDWLRDVEVALAEPQKQRGEVVLFFAFCGHGAAGKCLSIDYGPGTPAYDIFDEVLLKIYRILGHDVEQTAGGDWPPFTLSKQAEWLAYSPWQEQRQVRTKLIIVVDTSRYLTRAESKMYGQVRARIANERRRQMSAFTILRPNLAPFGGAELTAASLEFLNDFGPRAPRLFFALSSDSIESFDDVVLVACLSDVPKNPTNMVELIGRAALHAQRRAQFRRTPLLLSFGGSSRLESKGALRKTCGPSSRLKSLRACSSGCRKSSVVNPTASDAVRTMNSGSQQRARSNGVLAQITDPFGKPRDHQFLWDVPPAGIAMLA